MGASGIMPLGVGAGGASFGNESQGGSREQIRVKINDLNSQIEKYEQDKRAQKQTAEKERIDDKIAQLEKRIANLQGRLDKAKNEQSGTEECQTCENRRYQDGSDDPGVSFKSATKISPEAAASAVRGHEMEHVYRNQAKAAREGKEVVSQSVRIKSAICPECGKSYVAGGETRTVTRTKPAERYNVGMEDKNQKGTLFNSVA